jgi:hypothetical protein
MMRAWKDKWLETFTFRLAGIQQALPADRLRFVAGVFALGCAAIAYEYISMLWTLWDTVPSIGVGAIALTGVLNAVLLILLIVLIGQIDLKRPIARIQWLGAMNLLFELGLAVGGILIAQARKGSLEAIQFFLPQFFNLVATVGMLWYAHSLKRHYGYESDL